MRPPSSSSSNDPWFPSFIMDFNLDEKDIVFGGNRLARVSSSTLLSTARTSCLRRPSDEHHQSQIPQITVTRTRAQLLPWYFFFKHERPKLSSIIRSHHQPVRSWHHQRVQTQQHIAIKAIFPPQRRPSLGFKSYPWIWRNCARSSSATPMESKTRHPFLKSVSEVPPARSDSPCSSTTEPTPSLH